MGAFIAQKTIKLLTQQMLPVKKARVGILGLTFKENVPDLRNSRIPDIVQELKSFGVEVLVHDPLGDLAVAMHEYQIKLSALEDFRELDGLILAVSHRDYLAIGAAGLRQRLKPTGVFIDVKSAYATTDFPAPAAYWQL